MQLQFTTYTSDGVCIHDYFVSRCRNLIINSIFHVLGKDNFISFPCHSIINSIFHVLGKDNFISFPCHSWTKSPTCFSVLLRQEKEKRDKTISKQYVFMQVTN